MQTLADRERLPEPQRSVEGENLEASRLLLALDSIPAMVHTAQPDGSCDYFNQRWLDYLGAALDDINGWKWTSRIHPEDADAFIQKFKSSVMVGEPFEAKARVRRQDGVYRWMLHRKVPLRDELGKIIKWYGSSIDIDELQRSEFYLAEGQRLSHVGSWTFNSAGFDHWSSELFKVHGLEPSAKAPSLEEYLALIHPEDREFVIETIQKMFAEGRGFDFTKRIVRPDGETRRVRCVGVPVTQSGTFRGFIGTGIDVTEQEQLNEELRRSEYYLAEGQRLAHAGSWSFKPNLVCDYWSRELYEILGFDPRNGIPTIHDYFTRVHPEDRGVVERTIQRMVAAGEGCDLKKRIIRPDGKQRVIRCVGMPVWENGVVARFIGTLMPGMDGLEVIAQIQLLQLHTRVVVLTTFESEQDIHQSLKAGARGYLLKDIPRPDLLDAIRRVHRGETCIPPRISQKLVEKMNRPELTEREGEILRLIAEGDSNKAIGNKLGITEGTVKTHVKGLLKKLQVPGRTAAVREAVHQGLIHLV